MNTPLVRPIWTIALVAWLAASSLAQSTPSTLSTGPLYQTPPPELAAIVDAPPPPAVGISPDRAHLLLMHRPGLPTIAELAEPELRIAGLRINPRTNGPSRAGYYTALVLMDLKTKLERPIEGLPKGARITNVSWSPDSAHIAFTLTRDDGIELWLAEVDKARAKRLIPTHINDAYVSAFDWLPDGKALLVKAIPARRPGPPEKSPVPTGPVIQETTGGPASAPTYQDLLKNPHDEALFDYYCTSQLMRVTLGGRATPVGAPAIFRGASPSPDGRYILVQTVHRPYSYLVTHFRFPHRIEIWDADGGLVKRLAENPLAENVPPHRDAVPTGPRNAGWRGDADAAVYWVEARDGGDPKQPADVRDAVYLLDAPFTGQPRVLASLGLRYGGVQWGNDQLALVNESWWTNRKTRTWRIRLGRPGAAPELLFDRSYEDRYTDPGSPVLERDRRGLTLLVTADEGRAIFLNGPGASDEGDRPFLDRFDLVAKETKRIWRSEAPYYEDFVAFLDQERNYFLTRRESPAEPPNYYTRSVLGDTLEPITRFPHPYPQLADVYKEIIRYPRNDGVMLTATLYLPPGKRPEDGPFPMLMWAYPREFKDADAAGQMRGSPYAFNAISPNGPLPFLATGYAVLDGPAMPIIGEGDAEPNDTYVEQLVASAKAAVDEVVRRRVADPERIAIGGHSYGGFMTANLLAHSDLFRTGIARSGAYNRTLTPFGFQAEERTFWEAPDVYFRMSPFMHANRIDEPILLIHGEADNNSGTFPLQSERFYNALKGHGAKARFVLLPHESHGYAARESILHMLWEMNAWLDQYVKNYPE